MKIDITKNRLIFLIEEKITIPYEKQKEYWEQGFGRFESEGLGGGYFEINQNISEEDLIKIYEENK